MSEEIGFSRQRHLGFIKLNRPQALNALTLPMILAMQEQLTAWEQDKSIQAVIIQAAEGKAFCAGGDVRSLYEAGKNNDPQLLDFFWHEYRLNYTIAEYKKPFIALLDGITMGGGVGISLHGSHPIVTEHFVFAMPETTIGFFPDIGASFLLSRCPDHMGLYLGLTGNRIKAADAMSLGLVKKYIPRERLPDLLDSLAVWDLSENPSLQIEHCLQQFREEAPADNSLALRASLSHCFQYDSIEAILSALEKEPGCQEIAAALQQKAPSSLKVTLEQIRRARALSLADCLKMDFCLVQHFMQQPDFYEGVRALLVDKDKNPQWKPKRLAEVSESKLQSYFQGGKELILAV